MVFTLTREEASRAAGVSTRTIDRYIQSGKIRTKRDGKVIMLHKEDVSQMKTGWIQTDYEVLPPKPMMTATISYDSREVQNEILQALETIVKEKDALIQELTFKLGRLEAEMQNTVPKLEHKKAVLALEEAYASRVQDMNIITQSQREIEQRFKRERMISTVLMIWVFVLLCACFVLMFHFFSLRGA